MAMPEEAYARDVQPYAGLTPCKKNKAFAKREKAEIKALEKRLKKYDADSAPALALKATMEKTKTRFANYGEAGLLCGADGLPHLIVDGNLEHLGECAVPGLGFLYVAGWIGYAGRSYVMLNKEQSKKPTEGEIIIDVPMALGLMMAAGAWPVKTFFELKNGTLTAPESEITVSPPLSATARCRAACVRDRSEEEVSRIARCAVAGSRSGHAPRRGGTIV